jgi:hypothetical protein
VALGVASAVALGADRAHAGQTVTFDYRDDRYLWPGQTEGGLAFIPQTVTDPAAPVPLVVFLHGLNADGTLHIWFGGGGHDLRDPIEQIATAHHSAFLVAAPSNTRGASFYKNLWPGFDTSDFVEATERAIEGKALIDRSRVFVVGHSAAGCNPNGGLLTAAPADGQDHVSGMLMIDTCLDEHVAHRLATRWPETRLWVTWQDSTWQRDTDAFVDVINREQPLGAWFRMQRIETASSCPHTAIVLPSLLRVLAQWVIKDDPPVDDSHPAAVPPPEPAGLGTQEPD